MSTSFPWLGAAGIALSVGGLFVPPLAVVAIVVGAIAIKRATRPINKRLGQATIALSSAGMVLFAALVLLGRGAAAPGVECRIGLEALSLAQEAHRKTRGRYAGSQEELGVPVAPAYFLVAHGEHLSALQKLKVGPRGQCPDCTFTMACRESPAGTWWTITTGGKAQPQKE